MRLAFDNMAHYTDFSKGYGLYTRRCRNGKPVTETEYKRVIRAYCKTLADSLLETGSANLPCDMGTISAAVLIRKPQYRGDKFIGYGKKNWETGEYDGTLKAFGIVYMPKHTKNSNLRCYGFVANRRLFKKVKESYESGLSDIAPVDFTDDMI